MLLKVVIIIGDKVQHEDYSLIQIVLVSVKVCGLMTREKQKKNPKQQARAVQVNIKLIIFLNCRERYRYEVMIDRCSYSQLKQTCKKVQP